MHCAMSPSSLSLPWQAVPLKCAVSHGGYCCFCEFKALRLLKDNPQVRLSVQLSPECL